MSSDAYTVKECRALLATPGGCAELEAAIARACGWRPYWEHVDGAAGGHSPSWQRGGAGATFETCFPPPPYLTTATCKPGYGDRCLEMLAALTAWATDELTVDEGSLNIAWEAHSQMWEVWAIPDWRATSQLDEWLFNEDAPTLADALCLALAAAGLLRKEGKADE